MATYTSHYNLTKPEGTERVNIAIINQNMDSIDAQMYKNAQSIIANHGGMAIPSNNNTHAAVSSGQYVYVYNHSSLAEGLYIAKSAISTNGALSLSNLTAVSNGGLNHVYSTLNSKTTFEEELQNDSTSDSDLKTIALKAWNKVPANGAGFIMQNSTGTVKHCTVFRRSNTGVVILLDIDGKINFYVVDGGNIIDAKSHDLSSIITENVITKTTSADGNITLTNADVSYKTPIFASLSGVSSFVGVCSISRYSGSWVIHVADANGNAKGNTQFTISIRCV